MSLLRLAGVKKRFGGVVALGGVDFALERGEIHALCGENGAGKSTLIKILSGVHPAGSFDGTYELDGAPARFASHADAKKAGLAVIYQELALCEELTVAENIFLGDEPLRGAGPLSLFIDHARMVREAERLLAAFSIELSATARVRGLGVGQKQLVEIAKALSRSSRVLILDEPTAALSEREAETLLELLRGLRARGTTCLYISHKLTEVFAIADRVTVLRDGKSIFTRDTKSLQTTEVIAAMCGRTVENLFPAPRDTSRVAQAPLLSVRGLSVAQSGRRTPRIRDVSFDVHPGEVVGIGGLLGAGRTELLLHLFGAFGVRTAGQVTLDGAPFSPSHPAAALSAGVALLSEERRRYGLCMDETVGFNLSLSSLGEILRGGLIDANRELVRSLQMAERVHLRSAAGSREKTLFTAARTLSGGNQQKVVLGKALLTRPRLLLLDEPTRGIDIGAKQEIYELIFGLCREGLAVLLVSSELPELLGLCDRVLVLHEGAFAGSFRRGEATAEVLLAAALGHPAAQAQKPSRSLGEVS